MMGAPAASIVAFVGLVAACARPGPPLTPAGPPTPPDPSSRAGVVCGGEDELRLEGKVIDATGAALEASGHCRVTIVRAELAGATIGIHAWGDAHVTVEDSRVHGGQRAIVAADRAVVECRNSEWIGRIQAEDHGRIVDLGDNVWTR